MAFGCATVLLIAALVGAWWWRGERARSRESLDPALVERREGARALPPAGPAAPSGVASSALREPLVFGAGHRVAILEYRSGLTVDQAGGVPALVVDALRVEVCAGDEELVGGALAAAFALSYPSRAGGHEYRAGASGLVVRQPPLSTRLAGETLEPGSCRSGWVAIPLGEGDDADDRLPAAILFDNSAYDFVPEKSRARHAWVLE